MARGVNRLRAMALALIKDSKRSRSIGRPATPKKIIVLHELLLGDTLMLAPLLATLRKRYAEAELFVSSNPAHTALFSGKPYGARVLGYSERAPDSLTGLQPAFECDLAILPGDNRHAIAAKAIGAKWVVGFSPDKRRFRDRFVDEFIELPPAPEALGDLFTLLADPESFYRLGLRYRPGAWAAPEFTPFEVPAEPYAVLHVGAGSPLRLWEPSSWRAVAQAITSRGLKVVWTAGPEETDLISQIDTERRHLSLAGRLDLSQLWHLLTRARVAVTLDTGIAHMAKLTCTPVTTLFGPGSAVLFGRGRFWANNAFAEVTVRPFPCRDQRNLFKREVPWVRRCNRTLAYCPRARCMEAITSEQVIAALPVE